MANDLYADLDSQHVMQAQASIGKPLESQGQKVVGHVVRQAAVPQLAAHERQHVLHQRSVGRVVGGLTAEEHHGKQLDLSAAASALTWIALQVLGPDLTDGKFKFRIHNQNSNSILKGQVTDVRYDRRQIQISGFRVQPEVR